MKKSELKKILKPLIKECIKESLLEDGLISGIIVEVMKSVSPSAPIVETTQPKADPIRERMQRNAFSSEQSSKLKEHKNKLMTAIGGNAYNGVNLFEGTAPGPAQSDTAQQSSPLSGVNPGDLGVDISSLFGTVGNHWNAHMNEIKERK
jgi:osmotically-inducible protein OsmY